MPIVTASKKKRRGAAATWASATYYTKGIIVRDIAADSGIANEMVSYYMQPQHAEHGGPYARYWGSGLAGLELEQGQEVTTRQMANLFSGLDPDGLKLSTNSNRGRPSTNVAYDLVFSMEKDLSVLWMLGDDAYRAKMEAFTDEAIRAAIAWAEMRIAASRRGTDGILVRGSHGLIAVELDHTNARPTDGQAAPQIHRHIVISAFVQGLDGKWGALDAEFLFDLQKTMAEISGQVIRQRTTEEFGYAWTRDAKGIPRIAGFDSSVRAQLSTRNARILDYALENGLDMTRRNQSDKAQRDTREAKNSCGDDPSAMQWAIEMLAAQGINFDTVSGEVLGAAKLMELTEKQAVLDRAWLDNNPEYTPLPSDVKPWEDKALVAAWRDKSTKLLVEAPLLAGLEGLSLKDRFAEAVAYTEPLTQDQIAHEVMMEVGRAHSTWREKDLIEALSYSDIAIADAEKYVHDFLKSENVVEIWGRADNPELDIRIRIRDQVRYVTKETLEKEKKLVEAVKLGLGMFGPRLSKEQFDAVLLEMATREHRPKLILPDSDQYELLHALAFDGNQIQGGEGQAGAGKSAAVEALTIMLKLGYLGEPPADRTCFLLIGCTLTANAAETLSRESGGMPASSLTMLVTRLRDGSWTLAPGAHVVIDEVSQASTAHLFELNEYIQAVGGRLILLGDTRQLQAVEAGGMVITMLQEIPEAFVFLADETRRQENLEERAVLASLHYNGHLGSPLFQRAVRALLKQDVDPTFVDHLITGGLPAVAQWYVDNGAVTTHDSAQDALEAVANEYWDEITRPDNTDTEADSAIVMAGSNPEVEMLNAAIIAEAVKRGILDGTDTIEFGRQEFLRRQRITLRLVDWKLDVRNGWQGTVEGVERVHTYKFKYATPSPFGIEKECASNTKVGEYEDIWFSEKKVAREQEQAEASLVARQAALNKYLNYKTQNPEVLAKKRDAVKKAKSWLAWASTLPSEGGVVPLKVTSRSKSTGYDDHLVVKMDNGLTRLLPYEYVKDHVEGGYAMTVQRAQGATVNIGILYNLMSYVGLSRGRKKNVSHLVIPPLDDQTIELDRAALVNTYEWMAGMMGATVARDLRTKNAARDAKDTTTLSSKINDNLKVSLSTTTTALTDQLATEIAASFILGENRVAIARDLRMTAGLNDAIVAKIRRLSLGREAISMSTDALYQGRNAVALSSKAMLLNYVSPYWATQQQIEAFGGTVKEDQLENGVEVVFPDPNEPEGWGKHTVYNGDQANGLPSRFAKASAPVSELEKRAMDQAKDPMFVQKIAGKSWIKGMPVVLTRGTIEGLEQNKTYTITYVNKSEINVKGDDGKTVRIEGAHLKKLESGFAITAHQLKEGCEADKFIAVASGLDLEDLDTLAKQECEVEIVLPDPDLTGDLTWQNHVAEVMNEHVTLDSQTSWEARSSLDLAATREGEEVGLEALQAEVKATAKMIDEVREFADRPRDLARRDIERELIAIREAQKDTQKRVKAAEDEEQRMNALLAVEAAERAINSAEERRLAVVSSLPDSDPSVRRELEKSAEFHSHDVKRMADAEKLLNTFVQDRVTAARKNPAAFTPALDETLPLKEAYTQQHERIAAIEFYRLKYNIKDPNRALGPKPEDEGVQLDDYREMQRVLGIEEVTDEVLREIGYDEDQYYNIEQEYGY